MKLLLIEETRKLLNLTEVKLRKLLRLGMPHLKIGNELRFIESEIVSWYEINCPSQEEIEERFIDCLGRTIEQYIKINEIASFLRIEKTKIYKLCQEGMPSQLVGRRRFFNLNDIIGYFRRGAIASPPPPEQPKKQKPVLFVVDGSYSPEKKQCGGGVVVKHEDQVTGYSFGFGKGTNIFAETMAIFHAMKLAKEKGVERAIVATDQLGFVNAEDKEKYINRTVSGIPPLIKNNMLELLQQLKGKISFVYYKDIKDKHGFTHMLYSNAHALSRQYVNSVLEGERLDMKHVFQSQVKSKIQGEEEKVFNIEFDKVSRNFIHFKVSLDGKIQKFKWNSKFIVKAALELADQLISSTLQRVKLYIKKIPAFNEDMKILFDPEKVTVPEKIKNLFEKLKRDTILNMEDHLEPYIHEYLQQRRTAS